METADTCPIYCQNITFEELKSLNNMNEKSKPFNNANIAKDAKDEYEFKDS